MENQISRQESFSASLDRLIVENVRDFAIFAVDLEGRVISWNPGVENLLGYEESEFVGQDFSVIFTAEDVKNAEHHKEMKIAATEGRAENQRWHRRRDGTEFFADGLVMPLKDKEGNVTALAKIMRDDTARRRLEEERERILSREREARAVLENAYRTNTDFLKLFSHELKNPLNTILGWTNILRKSSLNEEQIAKALETIERSGKLQARLIEDVFDLARISSGKLQLQKVEINLNDAVRQAVESISPSAAAKNISLETSIEAENVTIKGDSERVQQLTLNLLNNSVKFTRAGGHIKVKLNHFDSTAQMKIEDDGAGIDPENYTSIFEPYSQANNKLEKKESGLGLGLALVKYLVEMHDGTVSVESDGPEKGATFTVTLPICDTKSETI